MLFPTPEVKPSRVRKIVRRLALAALILPATAGLLEITVRRVAPQELIADVVTVGGPICHRLTPGARGVQRSAGYAVDIQINEQGLRDHFHPYEKQDGVFRVLMLGGSHAFGSGVELEGAFPQVLERSLNADRRGMRDYEVINAGIVGFNTGHQYQYLNTEGRLFNPDLVVVVVDFVHDVSSNNELFTLIDGRPMRTSRACVFETSRFPLRVPFVTALRGHSHAFRFVGRKAIQLVESVAGRAEASEDGAEPKRMDLTVTTGILGAMSRSLEQRGTDLAVVILPELKRYREQDLTALESYLRGHNISQVSLGPEVGGLPSDVTFRRSGHFSPAEHTLLAQKIRLFLEQTGKLGGPQSRGSSR